MTITGITQVGEQVHAASLTDVMGSSFYHRAHIPDLVSPTPGRSLVGPAVTISSVPLQQESLRRNSSQLRETLP